MGQRKHRIARAVGLIAATSALCLAAAAPASAAPFAGSMTGELEVTSTYMGNPATAHYWGSGTTSPLGSATMDGNIAIVGPADCVGGFKATHTDTLVLSGGTVSMTIKETSCPTGPGTYECKGAYTITGGTGAYSGAGGSGRWAGALTFDSPTQGTFTSQYTGGLTETS